MEMVQLKPMALQAKGGFDYADGSLELMAL